MNFLILVLSLISFVAYKIYRSVKVPKELRNIPTLSFSDLVVEIFNKDGIDKRWESTREVMEKEGIGKLWFAGEWVIVVTDLGLARDLLTKTDLFHKIPLLESFPNSLLAQYYGTNLVISNGDVWKRHRRIANPAFRHIPVHVFNKSSMKFLEFMEKIDNEPIEVSSIMHRLALDILGRAAFGFDFNNLEDPDNVYVSTYNEVMEEISNPVYFLVPFFEYLPRTRARKLIAKLNSLYDGIVENKRKSMQTGELDVKIKNNSADLLEYMLKASSDPENPTLTDEELRFNLAIFMLAGHDTTANSLTTVLYLLAVHKDAQKKVRDEILRVLGDNLIPSTEQQKELKYMNMVINENLRLYPPVATLQRRYPLQDIKFRDHVIPAKSPIMLFIYGVHHSSKNWNDPEKFIPERFENENERHDYSWLGFGGGNRACIGSNFSLIEQRVILCSLLRKYEVSLPADSIHKDKLKIAPEKSGTFGPRPLSLIFKRRTE